MNTNKTIQTEEALSRLSGCDQGHLSLYEAKLIQALRGKGISESDVMELTALIVASNNSNIISDMIRSIQYNFL